MFFIMTALLAMSARWFSSFSRYYGSLLVLPFELIEHVSPYSQGEWLAHKLRQD
jgi:hypothetical protein